MSGGTQGVEGAKVTCSDPMAGPLGAPRIVLYMFCVAFRVLNTRGCSPQRHGPPAPGAGEVAVPTPVPRAQGPGTPRDRQWLCGLPHLLPLPLRDAHSQRHGHNHACSPCALMRVGACHLLPGLRVGKSGRSAQGTGKVVKVTPGRAGSSGVGTGGGGVLHRPGWQPPGRAQSFSGTYWWIQSRYWVTRV